MAKSYKLPKSKKRRPSRFQRTTAKWPFLVWLATIGFAVVLYMTGIEFAVVKGVIQKYEENVAPIEVSRVESVEVVAGDEVKKGQILVRMDATLIDAEMDVESALADESEESINAYQGNILQLDSRFSAAMAQAEATVANEQRLQAEAQAELKYIDAEVKRLDALIAIGGATRSAVGLLKARQAALQKAVELYPATIAALARHLADAKQEASDLREWMKLEPGESVSDAILQKKDARDAIHEKELALLKMRRREYDLVASRDGVVARVLQQSGDIVGPQVPVLSIVERRSDDVVAFIPEGMASSFKADAKATVMRPSEPKSKFKAVVSGMAPDIVWLPTRVSPLQGQQGMRGLRVTLKILESHNLMPGETVDIRFLDGKKPFGSFGEKLSALFNEVTAKGKKSK